MTNGKKKILIIEDKLKDADAIASFLESEYDCGPPRPQAKKLIPNYATYNKAGYIAEERSIRRKVIADFFVQHAHEVACYIIDYRLKPSEEKFASRTNGVELCRAFKTEMGRAPLLFLTNTDNPVDYEDIHEFAKEEAGYRLVDFMAKPGDDWMTSAQFGHNLLARVRRMTGAEREDLGHAPN
jgi:CheY-like chemotaxis protein